MANDGFVRPLADIAADFRNLVQLRANARRELGRLDEKAMAVMRCIDGYDQRIERCFQQRDHTLAHDGDDDGALPEQRLPHVRIP